MNNLGNAMKTCCPLWIPTGYSCRASFSRHHITTRSRHRYCFSDNYDNCPLYLAEMLRRCRQRPEMAGITRLR